MHIWDYQGAYKGHVWDDPKEELIFARSDLEHAYVGLLRAGDTIETWAAKNAMDQAMDRIVRAIARITHCQLCDITTKPPVCQVEGCPIDGDRH